MMQGFVNQSCEAIIPIVVGHSKSTQQMVQALIDTGFTGFLSLPLSMIESLELPWIFRDSATLGDGSEVLFDMYLDAVARIAKHHLWSLLPVELSDRWLSTDPTRLVRPPVE